jgi:prefoldin subunit 5
VAANGRNGRDEELARLARERARLEEQWAELQPKLAELAASGVDVRVSDEVIETIESIQTTAPNAGAALHYFQRA